MSGKPLVEQIKHYQKDIERCPENSERMIRCIQRLYVLPIQVLHLQETGVGRSVNSLRKYKGEVGEAAKALVAKWKAMVAAEESSDDSEKLKTKLADNKVVKPPISSVKVEVKPLVKVEPKAEKIIVKTELKSDKTVLKEKPGVKDISSRKDVLNSREKYSNGGKHMSHHSSSRHHRESQSLPKSSSPSLKRSHSASEKISSHKNHKSSHHEKNLRYDDKDSPSSKKHKKHHSDQKHHQDLKEEVKESDEERDDDRHEGNEAYHSQTDVASSDSEKESSEVSENSSFEDVKAEEHIESKSDEDSDNSSSDHRHRSKRKSSHHKHNKSSHSDKNKENLNTHRGRNRHSNKKSPIYSNLASPNLEQLIKENEKKIKKEKEDFVKSKCITSKKVKVETNDDGSIDNGSGASFADALLGMDNYLDKKNKKKSPQTKESLSMNHKSSSHKSSSGSHKKSHNRSSTSTKEKSRDSSSSKSKTIDELVETPELLTRKVKLEALDLDISSTLPDINPNYKPLPHIPESSRRQLKTMSEEETMFSIMTTKNQRTKVYSGNKVYQNTIPSLFNLCIQLLYENIDAVEYTGGVPYILLKPLLERLNSDQLYVIEHFNPYLIEDTDNLWKFHCNKDFRNEKRQDMESWRDLYLRCLEERERKLKALTANISQSMAKSTPVRQAKLAYVDSFVKPPRNVARKQAKYGTGGTNSTKISTPNIKQEIVNKAIVGGHTPGVSATDVVPLPPAPRAAHHVTPTLIKKKKAPLMQKALQFIKGNRYKR